MGTCTVSCISVCTRPYTYTCECCSSTCTDSNGDDYDCNCSPCTCHGCYEYKQQAQSRSMSPRSFSGSCGVPSGGCSKKGVGGGNLSSEQCRERAATCGGVNPPPPECGSSSPPLGNCKNGSGSSPTLVAGSTDTYEWTCSVGSLSTTCTGTTTTINTTNCTCTANGCSADCDKNTDGDNWVCESPDGGNDSKTCKPNTTNCTCTANGCSADCEKKTSGNNWVCESPDGGNDSKTCTQGGTTTDCSCTTNECSADCDKNTTGDHTWICESPDGGNDSPTCDSGGGGGGTVICGVCGDTNETCKVGTPEQHPPNTPTEFIWNCRNIPHTKGQCAVAKILCTAAKPTTPTSTPEAILDGVCDESRIRGCAPGTVSQSGRKENCQDNSSGSPTRFYEWECNSTNGGDSSGTCYYEEGVECCRGIDCNSTVCLGDVCMDNDI